MNAAILLPARSTAAPETFQSTAVAVATIGLAVVGLGLAWQTWRSERPQPQWAARLPAFGCLLASMTILAGLLLPGRPGWFTLAAGELGSLSCAVLGLWQLGTRTLARRPGPTGRVHPPHAVPPAPTGWNPGILEEPQEFDEDVQFSPAGRLPVSDEAEEAPDESLISQWVRRSTPAGGHDRLEGVSRVVFTAGQKQATIHIPFCPPFAHAPHLTCDLEDSDEVRMKGVTVYSYGARVELKRRGDCSFPSQVRLAYQAELLTADMM